MWWLWLPLGIALIVVGVVTGSNPVEQGGPILIGVACLFWGLAGAYVKLFSARRSVQR
jgi:hypothetical protein